MPLSLQKRTTEKELMDNLAIDSGRFIGSLKGLYRLNRAMRSPHILWPVVRAMATTISDRPLRILDVACGGGDNLITLSRWAKRNGIEAQFDGCDLSPLAIAYARENANASSVDTHLFIHDAVGQPLPDGYDLIMCSLFLHHLSDHDAIQFLQKSAAATKRTVAVHDLIRTRSGYWLAWFGMRMLLCNDVCQHDGPLSVAKAFTLYEMQQITYQAGLQDSTLGKRFPGKFLWVWNKTT